MLTVTVKASAVLLYSYCKLNLNHIALTLSWFKHKCCFLVFVASVSKIPAVLSYHSYGKIQTVFLHGYTLITNSTSS